jgi:hypothetical protein
MAERPPDKWCPDLSYLEDAAASVVREAERLLTTTRAELRAIQDYEAELAEGAGDDYGRLQALRHQSAHRLRWIARHFSLAQGVLVPPSDERYRAAQDVRGWLEDADRGDSPWRTLERVEPPAEAA